MKKLWWGVLIVLLIGLIYWICQPFGTGILIVEVLHLIAMKFVADKIEICKNAESEEEVDE